MGAQTHRGGPGPFDRLSRGGLRAVGGSAALGLAVALTAACSSAGTATAPPPAAPAAAATADAQPADAQPATPGPPTVTVTVPPTAAAPAPTTTTTTAAPRPPAATGTPAAAAVPTVTVTVRAPAPKAPAAPIERVAPDRYRAAVGWGDVWAFRSPTGNITCALAAWPDTSGDKVVSRTSVECDITERDWQPPRRPASCGLSWGLPLTPEGFSCRGDVSTVWQVQHTPGVTVPPLPYGRSLTVVDVTCTSRHSGVTCTQGRHGLRLSRASYDTW